MYPNINWYRYSSVYKVIKVILSYLTGKRLIRYLADRKIASYKAIFVGFAGDREIIRNRFGKKVSIFTALYPMGFYKNDIDSVLSRNKVNNISPEKYINILLGHSGYDFLQHEKWIEKLIDKKLKINIFLPLNYGDQKYINKIKKRCNEVPNIFPLTEFMDYGRYICYLRNMDWAIFDFKHQAAFGNMILLFYLGKRVYLDPQGIMYKTFSNLGLKVFSVNDLIKDILKPKIYDDVVIEKNKLYAEKMLSEDLLASNWIEAFDCINIVEGGKS